MLIKIIFLYSQPSEYLKHGQNKREGREGGRERILIDEPVCSWQLSSSTAHS